MSKSDKKQKKHNSSSDEDTEKPKRKYVKKAEKKEIKVKAITCEDCDTKLDKDSKYFYVCKHCYESEENEKCAEIVTVLHTINKEMERLTLENVQLKEKYNDNKK